MSGIRMTDASRAQFDGSAKTADFRALAQDPRVKVLQCVAAVPDAVWTSLNDAFSATRPDVQIRAYGHYSDVCDLAFARLLGNVRHFAADCLTRARNADALGAMTNLESLSFGVFEAEDFAFLDAITPRLTSLALGTTRSKKPRLTSLQRFRALSTLHLDSQCRDIEVVGGLHALEDVTLRSITTPGLDYLALLPNLQSLDIKLGSIRNFAAIAGKASIRYLELWQVRELRDASVISTLPGLQNLFLQSLPHVAVFPDVSGASQLRRVTIENLKGLRDFSALEHAPALEEFALVDGRAQVPEQLLPVLRNPALRTASAHFGSIHKNDAFRRLREAHDKGDLPTLAPFVYR